MVLGWAERKEFTEKNKNLIIMGEIRGVGWVNVVVRVEQNKNGSYS